MIQHVRHILLKLRDGTVQNGIPSQAFAAQYAQVVARYPGLGAIAPLFTQSDDDLGNLQKAALQNDPSYTPTDFRAFVRLRFSDGVPLRPALRDLRRIPEVIHAGVQAVGSGPHDPWVESWQPQIAAAPTGVDALHAWTVTRGAGVTVAVIERGWWVKHSEFLGAPFVATTGGPALAYGAASADADDQRHGTEMLGILCALTDAAGIEGVANGATVRLYSYLEDEAGVSENLAAALMQAVVDLSAGDVILLEVQISEDKDPPSWTNLPAEYAAELHAVIRLASALGIAVIEPAGNADEDLGSVTHGGSWTCLDRDHPDFRDSGALMVGASKQDANKRLGGTNYGNRVDLFALGENVYTTVPYADAADFPYDWSNGTSPASAAIAGVAALFQSRAGTLGRSYSTFQLRWLFSHADYSTPDEEGGSATIGRMPDLAKLLAGGELPATPDLFLRDHVGDDGSPHDGALAKSPDLILRRAKAADPEAEFGAGSGRLDDLSLHESAVAGATHWLYARASERNGVDADAAEVALYWSPPATLILPDDWTWIGAAKIPATPAGGVAVSDGLEWSTVPAPGHYCLLGLLSHAADPAPAVPDFAALEAAGVSAWDAFRRFLRASNNATWRNFNVVAAGDGAAAASGVEAFLLRGAPDRARTMRLVLRSSAKAGTFAVTLPAGLEAARVIPTAGVETAREGMRLTIPAGGEITLEWTPEARSWHRLVLEWTAPAAASGAVFDAIQYAMPPAPGQEEPVEVGRISWTWSAGRSRPVPAPRLHEGGLRTPARSG